MCAVVVHYNLKNQTTIFKDFIIDIVITDKVMNVYYLLLGIDSILQLFVWLGHGEIRNLIGVIKYIFFHV